MSLHCGVAQVSTWAVRGRTQQTAPARPSRRPNTSERPTKPCTGIARDFRRDSPSFFAAGLGPTGIRTFGVLTLGFRQSQQFHGRGGQLCSDFPLPFHLFR